MSERSKARARRTIARHGELDSPRPLRQLMRLLAVAAAVVLVSALGVAGYAAYDLSSSFTANAVELEGQKDQPQPQIRAIDDVNVLLTGIDACEPEIAHFFGGRCEGPESEGVLNDVNMLVHISAEPRRVTAITFPRDMMVSVPECTDEQGNQLGSMSHAQINSIYANGGASCIAKTVSELSGQEVQYAATVSWKGVMDITDAIGGVDVCVANGIYDEHTGLNLDPGEHTLQGLEALQFLRTRHGVGDGSDLARIGNQQVYMSTLVRKMVSEEVLGDPSKLLTLARTTLSSVTPSTTLTNPMTLVQLAMAMKDVPLEDIVFVRYPVLEDPSDANRVVPDEAAADQLWAAIEANQPLQVDMNTGDNAGAVEGEEPAETTPPEDGEQTQPTQTPGSGLVGIPSSKQTCSNGSAGGS